jgi:Ca-activated chloride channel family protein
MRVTKMRSSVTAVGRCARSAAVLAVLACACVHVVRAQPSGAAAARPSSEGAAATLRLTVTVTNPRGEFVMGLGGKDFVVTAGGRPREVAYAEGRDVPASVGVLLDASASMGYVSSQRIASEKAVRDAVSRFVGLGHDASDYFVARIGTRPELISDWARAERVDLGRAATEERAVATALYDSLYAALEKLDGARNSKRVLVVMSDGLDTVSEHRLEELTRRLRESDVIVYAVGVVGGLDPGTPARYANLNSSVEKRGRDVLEELASNTGGRVFYPENAKQLAAAFDAVAVELRHQYELGVRLDAADAAGKKPLALEVKVNSPGGRPDLKRLSARTRKTYQPKP